MESFRCIPVSGTAGSYGSSCFRFWAISIPIAIVVELIYYPAVSTWGFSPALLNDVLIITILIGIRWNFNVVLIWIYLIAKNIGQFFMIKGNIYFVFWELSYISPFIFIFKKGLFLFYGWMFCLSMSHLHLFCLWRPERVSYLL